MNYLISEEELKELFWWYNNHDITVDNTIKDFLKSKQPVKLLAEGEVNLQGDNIFVGNTDLWDKFYKRKTPYENIKLYVGVSK